MWSSATRAEVESHKVKWISFPVSGFGNCKSLDTSEFVYWLKAEVGQLSPSSHKPGLLENVEWEKKEQLLATYPGFVNPTATHGA